ncbi:hypothetical protein GCM10018954_005640 [Kutzneria kofuensis]
MDLTILLADAAQVSHDQKVSALGLGWTATQAPLPPHAVVVFFEIDWNETNQRVHTKIILVNADGHPVRQQTETGEQEIFAEGEMEFGRPPGLPAGTPITFPITFGIAPGIQLPSGRYEWRASVDGHEKTHWRRAFLVMS